MKKCVTFGEMMLRLSPSGYDRIIQTSQFGARYVGAEANVAVSISLLGQESEYVSKMPANDVGDSAVNTLRHWGVGTRHVVRGGDRLGIFFVEAGAAQRPSKVIYDRAHSAIAEADPSDFDWDAIFADADWFHFSGITPALSKNAEQACYDACKAAKRRGVTISFDPNYRAKLWSTEAAGKCLAGLAEYADVLIVNENQAAQLFGIKVPAGETDGENVTPAGYLALAEALRARFGAERIAVTERRTFSAEENSIMESFYEGGKLYQSPKYRMHMVDRVGSGDAFAAGLIFALREGYDPQRAVDFAAAASCLNHSVEGDFNLVNFAEINALAAGNVTGRVQR